MIINEFLKKNLWGIIVGMSSIIVIFTMMRTGVEANTKKNIEQDVKIEQLQTLFIDNAVAKEKLLTISEDLKDIKAALRIK